MMTPKEALYVEDALSHAKFLAQQSQNAAAQLQDKTLAQEAQTLFEQQQKIFQQFYALV